eukprot:g11641.t1 g11641   contig6:281126-281455(-)
MSGEGNEYGGLLFQSDDESNGGGGDSERNEASAGAADDDGNSSTTHLVDLIARLAVDDDEQPPVKSDLTSAIRRIGAPFCAKLFTTRLIIHQVMGASFATLSIYTTKLT